MKLKYILFIFAMIGLMGVSSPVKKESSSSWIQKEYELLKNKVRSIDGKVLRLALTAYKKALTNGYIGKPILTVIDYSKRSSEKRLTVIDMKKHDVLFNTWVSHGKNSGGLNSTSFSNSPGSYKSSLGVFQTEATYSGKNGYSLRLKGLEHGINDYAYSRAIVVHGAPYVNGGGAGRSLGCPAVMSSLAKPIINTIKDKSLIFAYGNDSRWLSRSSYL